MWYGLSTNNNNSSPVIYNSIQKTTIWIFIHLLYCLVRFQGLESVSCAPLQCRHPRPAVLAYYLSFAVFGVFPHNDLLWGTSSSFQLCQTSVFSFNGLLCVVKQSFNIVLLSIQKTLVSRGTAVTGICSHIIRQWSGGALHSIDGAISVDRLDLIVES